MTSLVKICGIREEEHALVAAESGADLIGFVFVPVRRQVAPERAAEIAMNVRGAFDQPPAAVGLFVNESAENVNEIVRAVGLDLVQFSGDESPELAGEIDVPVIKAIRIEAGAPIDEIRTRIEGHLRFSAGVLIDSHVKGKWGGTGVVGDWDLASELARDYPVVLAGGLSPENVAEAARRVQPAVVDVSSGVETDGRKDSEKIRAFIKQARAVRHDAHGTLAARLVETITERRGERTASQTTRLGAN